MNTYFLHSSNHRSSAPRLENHPSPSLTTSRKTCHLLDKTDLSEWIFLDNYIKKEQLLQETSQSIAWAWLLWRDVDWWGWKRSLFMHWIRLFSCLDSHPITLIRGQRLNRRMSHRKIQKCKRYKTHRGFILKGQYKYQLRFAKLYLWFLDSALEACYVYDH